ncbi:hypothetical protein CNMCM6106_003596 [Aspergillus hiratsukae]|uniref:FAD-binding domain-containing protein n=1 Tax=Aspergillus hiratsukae TaxID=1194566 RepID=A0A8H6UVC2_9EURO|nr:hypothetical protein CNMCM6106_003596 [Aspergillus hiratsukae]
MAPPIHIKQKQTRVESCRLQIFIVGAGLASLGAASVLLAGHDVHVLESAHQVGEVGAGIQVLPNSSRVLQHWGLEDALTPYMTRPRVCNFIGWKGNLISSLDFHESEKQYPGTWYRDFHRADLHRCLLDRALELGAEFTCNARVVDVRVGVDEASATAVAADGREWTGDLVIGADGVFGTLVEKLPEEMLKDSELAGFVTDPQVNYWLGPDAHAVNYALRGGEKFNMVLLVPDDIPEDSLASTVEGNVQEMCALFEGWDPRAGMAFEDGAVLGECLSRLPDSPSVTKTSPEYLQSKRHALSVFEKCRKQRTKMVVDRGNVQQYLYHLHDGLEQKERDRKMQMVPTPEGEALAWRDPGFAPTLLGYAHIADVDLNWNVEDESEEIAVSRL